jgi:hypothetical protein
MLIDNTTNILCLIILCVNIFIAGYLIGKNYTTKNTDAPQSFLKNQKNNTSNKTINIDETKYVGNIKTDNIEKKYNSLGETVQSTDKIDSAVNKLKNMKG